MSKLIQKLNEAYEGPAQSMGFKPTSTMAAQPMVLLMIENDGNIKDRSGLVSQVDALIQQVDSATQPSFERGDTPEQESLWGLWSSAPSHEQLQQALEAGADFAVLDPEKTPAFVAQMENIGKILKIDCDCKDMLLTTICEMPIDAILVEIGEGRETCLTIFDLMLCRRVVDVTCRPLIVVTNPHLSQEDVKALWEVGVGGIAFYASAADPESLALLRQSIVSLPTKRDKPSEGNHVLLSKSLKKDIAVQKIQENQETCGLVGEGEG